eukprot:4563698-Pyramimonas_sp.AAC.1
MKSRFPGRGPGPSRLDAQDQVSGPRGPRTITDRSSSRNTIADQSRFVVSDLRVTSSLRPLPFLP